MVTELANFLLDLVFPPFCQACTREGSYLCLECQNKIEAPIQRCPKCGRNSTLGKVHAECGGRDMALSGLMMAAEYSEPAVKNLIWNLKYNSVKAIGPVLATIMTDFIIGADLQDYFHESIIMSVPMHGKRRRFRGFNQADEIAKALARNLRLEFSPGLIKTKNTIRQVELEKAKRLENLKGAFELNPKFDSTRLTGRSIILIDDVATTSATLNECALVLKKQNPSEIWGLVVARN